MKARVHSARVTLQNFPIVQQQEHAYSPRVQLFLYGNDGKVRFSGAHVLRAAAALKHVQLLRGELPPAPEIHLSRARGHYGNRRLCRCAQPRRNEKERVTGLEMQKHWRGPMELYSLGFLHG